MKASRTMPPPTTNQAQHDLISSVEAFATLVQTQLPSLNAALQRQYELTKDKDNASNDPAALVTKSSSQRHRTATADVASDEVKTVEHMADLLNEYLLQMPSLQEIRLAESTMNPNSFFALCMRMVVLLGPCGSSIERHEQEQLLRTSGKENVKAGRGLARLHVSTAHTPFLEYFTRVAEYVGHIGRDTYQSIVSFNGPAYEVKHPFNPHQTLYTSASNIDGKWVTLTNNRQEIEFYDLLKRCEVLQVAANHLLAWVQDPAHDLDSMASVENVKVAAVLLNETGKLMSHFLRKSNFTGEFFVDEFRQFFCIWRAKNPYRAPSGANDPSSVHRDAILFEDLVDGYTRHVRAVLDVAMKHQIDEVEKSISLPSLDTRIQKKLGLDPTSGKESIANLSEEDKVKMIEEHGSWLKPYWDLYKRQAEDAQMHHQLVLRYLVKPVHLRETAGNMLSSPKASSSQETSGTSVVDNKKGTTSMTISRLEQLRDARRLNFLRPLMSARQHQKHNDAVKAFFAKDHQHGTAMTPRGTKLSSRELVQIADYDTKRNNDSRSGPYPNTTRLRVFSVGSVVAALGAAAVILIQNYAPSA